MTWNGVRGHRGQREMMQRAVARGRLAHAYLFTGADGVGKLLFARTVAQGLLCRHRADDALDPCGVCPGCKQVQAESHPDLFIVRRPPGKREHPLESFVGPPERRGKAGLCYDLAHTPLEGGRKIAIIDDAHLLNEESSNALLKTIEEPPPFSVIFLIAGNRQSILPTIRSRCQAVRFGTLSDADVAEILLEQGMAADRSAAEQAARLGQGSVSAAAKLLDPGLDELRQAIVRQLSARPIDGLQLFRQVWEYVEASAETAGQRERADWVLRTAAESFRHAWTEAAGQRRSTEGYELEAIELLGELFERTLEAQAHIEQNVSVPLCLEAWCVALAQRSRPDRPAKVA